MGDSVKRVLFVNSETVPFLPETPVSKIGRVLPQGIQDRKKEIRTFMPRYGCINERKNQLHEVIRLSGMNIIIGDVDRQLVIKVASISSARIQVYFIDNDDYFKRKQLTYDTSGKFFEDNGQRAIFFARGVIETVKKLRWAPDIVHCSGWISSLVPLYLKKAYNGDPIFSNCKIVSSFFGEIDKETFAPDFADMIRINGITEADVPFSDPLSGINLAELAALYSDGVIFGSKDIDGQLENYCKNLNIPVLPYDEKLFDNDSYIEEYDRFYEQL